MSLRDRVQASIEFSLLGRPRASLEEVGYEYRRRSPHGNTIAEDGGGKTLRSWIEGELSEYFQLSDEEGKLNVHFREGARRHPDRPLNQSEKLDLLEYIHIGTGIAERRDDAGFAFIPTKAWRGFVDDSYDIFVGAKGSGKSQILRHAMSDGQNDLPSNIKILHFDATKDQYFLPPRSALSPLSVEAHKGIWLLLISIKAYFWIKNDRVDFDTSIIEKILHETGFLEDGDMSGRKNRIVSFLVDLRKNVEFSAKADIEGIGSIEIRPTEKQIDSAALMRRSERACIKFLKDLAEKRDIWLWFAIDRTDVLFDGERDLEIQSLQALLLLIRDDIGGESAAHGFKAKLFLKSDVWTALSKRSIPEFSHLVARRIELNWTLFELQKIIASRFARNPSLMEEMRYSEESALKNRVGIEDFVAMLLPRTPLPDRGGPRKPSDWILRALRDGNGTATPRDYIRYFRRALEYERDQIEREGLVGAWQRRHLLQQISLLMARKLLAIEKIDSLVGEFYKVESLKNYIKRNAVRELSTENLSEAIGETFKEDVDRLLSLGLLRLDEDHDRYIVPWFYFDALVSRDRQIALGYEVPNTRESTPERQLENSSSETLFLRGTYMKADGREIVTAMGRRIRLPPEAIGVLRARAIPPETGIQFWIFATRRGTWVVDSSRPLIVGRSYEFRVGGGWRLDPSICSVRGRRNWA